MAEPTVTIKGVFRAAELRFEGASLNEIKDMLAELGVSGIVAQNSSNGVVVKNAEGGHLQVIQGEGKKGAKQTTEAKKHVKEDEEEEPAPKKTAKAEKPPTPATRKKTDEDEEEDDDSEDDAEEEAEASEDDAEEEAPKKQAKAAKKGKGGKIDPKAKALQEAARLREVVSYFHDQGYKDLEEMVGIAEEIKDEVPILRRVADIPVRMKAAYNLFKEDGNAA